MRGWNQFKNVLPVMLGSAIYAFGLHYFVIPNEFMEGGVTGIALLINYAFNIPPSVTTLLLNIPLFLIGWKMFGKRAIFLTVVGTVSLSFFLWMLEIWIRRGWITPFHTTQDYFLVVLYAGMTIGLGLGIVFRFGGTTGGSDILARLGNKWMGWSMGKVILAIDAVVIGSALLYIPKEKILYTLVVVFVASKTIDFVQEGAFASKAFMIISERPHDIAELIKEKLDHGVTLFQATGGYSRKYREVVYCVVYRHEARKLKTLVRNCDPRAFIIIHDVQDVLGEGFKPE